MFRACELKDQTYKKTRTLHFSDFRAIFSLKRFYFAFLRLFEITSEKQKEKKKKTRENWPFSWFWGKKIASGGVGLIRGVPS